MVGWRSIDAARSVSAVKCGNNQKFSIHMMHLQLIMQSMQGCHAILKICGDYMQYGIKAKVDCSTADYYILDEYEAVSIRTGIKTQVCIAPDVGGIDSLKRRRFFWNDRLYSH